MWVLDGRVALLVITDEAAAAKVSLPHANEHLVARSGVPGVVCGRYRGYQLE